MAAPLHLRYPIRSYASFILQISAGILISQGYFLSAQICALASAVLSGMDVPPHSSWLQFLLFFTGGILLGASIEYSSGNYPLMTIGLGLLNLSVLLRLLFFGQLTHTKLLWLDPFVYGTGILLYLAANIAYGYSWPGWVLPVPLIFVNFMLIRGFIKEGTKYREKATEGYMAELGKPAPDFSLPDQEGKVISLSGFRGQRHVLLLFIRGDWCPACHVMLRTYEKNKEKFQAKNVFLMAVGPDPVGVNKEMADRIGVDYTILADERMKVAAMYGLQTENPLGKANPHGEDGLPLPASFLICDKGIVRYHSSPERVGEFLKPDLVFNALAKI